MDVDLAIKLSKLIHDECKEVPHNIGITLTRIIEKHQKKLTLTVVNQQRELLLDFWMKMPKTHKHKGVAEHYIDNYLKSNN